MKISISGDYATWGPVQEIAARHPGLAIVGNHHQRKGAADDVVDTVMGSQGFAAVADTILILRRPRT